MKNNPFTSYTFGISAKQQKNGQKPGFILISDIQDNFFTLAFSKRVRCPKKEKVTGEVFFF
jgi:hypothetical protein